MNVYLSSHKLPVEATPQQEKWYGAKYGCHTLSKVGSVDEYLFQSKSLYSTKIHNGEDNHEAAMDQLTSPSHTPSQAFMTHLMTKLDKTSTLAVHDCDNQTNTHHFGLIDHQVPNQATTSITLSPLRLPEPNWALPVDLNLRAEVMLQENEKSEFMQQYKSGVDVINIGCEDKSDEDKSNEDAFPHAGAPSLSAAVDQSNGQDGHPELIFQSRGLKAWHKTDVSYGIPKVTQDASSDPSSTQNGTSI